MMCGVLKERRGYSHLKEEVLDLAMWRAGFGRGFGPGFDVCRITKGAHIEHL
jgi:hypothetical protein